MTWEKHTTIEGGEDIGNSLFTFEFTMSFFKRVVECGSGPSSEFGEAGGGGKQEDQKEEEKIEEFEDFDELRNFFTFDLEKAVEEILRFRLDFFESCENAFLEPNDEGGDGSSWKEVIGGGTINDAFMGDISCDEFDESEDFSSSTSN
jgi:hypothetical protein